jgi:hypothetical protein
LSTFVSVRVCSAEIRTGSEEVAAVEDAGGDALRERAARAGGVRTSGDPSPFVSANVEKRSS